MQVDTWISLADAAQRSGAVLLLLALANGLPIAAKRVLGTRLARPVDGGFVLRDGQPLFGQAKTWRGLLASVAGTALLAPLLGLPWQAGAAAGAAAMAGDLCSSFVKRRRGLAPSSSVPWLDQLPESVLPVLAVREHARLGWIEALLVVAAFVLLAPPLSRLLFLLRLRDRPY